MLDSFQFLIVQFQLCSLLFQVTSPPLILPFSLSKSSSTGIPVITPHTHPSQNPFSHTTFLQILSAWFAFFLCSSVLHTVLNFHLSRLQPFPPPQFLSQFPHQHYWTHTKIFIVFPEPQVSRISFPFTRLACFTSLAITLPPHPHFISVMVDVICH